MLQFQSLGDGNCLYNTEAVWLMYAYQQQLLQPLFKNKVAKFNKLMAIVGEQNPTLGLPKTEVEYNTAEKLINAFDTLIAKVAVNDDIDWVKLQQLLAPALRELVVDLIENDEYINKQARAELSGYLDHMVDSFHVVKKDNSRQNEIIALQVEVLERLKEFSGNNPKPAPRKLPEIKKHIENEFVTFITQQIAASNQTEAIQAIVIENLSDIVKQLISNSKKRTLNTLREDVLKTLRERLESIIENGMPDDEIVLAAHFEGMEEIQEKINSILKDPKKPSAIQKREIKAWFFDNDAEGLASYLDNIAENGVNAGEFEQKVLSAALGHVMKVRSLEYLDAHNTRVVNGFKKPNQAKMIPRTALVFEMEKLPGHWNALLDDTEANRELIALYASQKAAHTKNSQRKQTDTEQNNILKEYGSYSRHHRQELSDLSVDEYCKTTGISKNLYQQGAGQQKLAQSAAKAAPQEVERDWFNYATMFFAVSALVGIVTHGLIWPLLTVLLPTLVRNIAINYQIATFKLTTSALFGAMSGIFITEKVHLDSEKITASQHPQTGPSLLNLFHLFGQKSESETKAQPASKPAPQPKAKAVTIS
ncbi:MAG: hypothetical protein JSR17_12385 [Proteobacteria bacterium]|nr:hypothetical protein [Pseudomonadota bacterium]